MRRFSDRHSLHTLSELNVTPLLDLAFVLLIIFMITTPLMENSVDLVIPTSEVAKHAVDPNAVALSAERRERTEALLSKSYDKANGGFGDTHRFIHGDTLEWVLERSRVLQRNAEPKAWREIGELFVKCGCDSRHGDVEGAGSFVGGRFRDPDFFRLCREWCRGQREFEAVEAFFGEGWGLEGLFDEIAELVGDVLRRREFSEFD